MCSIFAKRSARTGLDKHPTRLLTINLLVGKNSGHRTSHRQREDVAMQTTEHRSFDAPDETREFPHGRAGILKMSGGEVGMMVFEPGWRWSNDVKPIANTDSCEAPHFQYH